LFFDQFSSLVRSLPGTASSVVQWLNDRLGMSIDANTMTSSLSLTPSHIQSWAGALSGGVVSAVGSLTSVVFDLVTVLVFGFYFAGDGPTVFSSHRERDEPSATAGLRHRHRYHRSEDR
jgi:predicted PurR-regulated permease PerM